MILAGDIGGTKTLLGLFHSIPEWTKNLTLPAPFFEKSYPSRQYPSFDLVLEDFLREARNIPTDGIGLTFAAFGVAGPVVNGRCETTNLPWVLETANLAKILSIGMSQVRLLNDLAAIAWGTMAIPENDLIVLNPGIPDPTGNQVIIAPGTGLGESIIARAEPEPIVIPTEGGHADWAPEGPEDLPLLAYLWSRFGHASSERLVSGQGIANLYRFHTLESAKTALPLDPRLSDEEIPAALAHAAISLQDPLCVRILDKFCALLGQEAGNMALKSLPTGGLFLAGGIPGKILPFLLTSSFMAHFTNKGRYKKLLTGIPVRIINNPDIGLTGAWTYASRHQADTDNKTGGPP